MTHTHYSTSDEITKPKMTQKARTLPMITPAAAPEESPRLEIWAMVSCLSTGMTLLGSCLRVCFWRTGR